MSKKVLILSGSPRENGNSDILCDEFMVKDTIELQHTHEHEHTHVHEMVNVNRSCKSRGCGTKD